MKQVKYMKCLQWQEAKTQINRRIESTTKNEQHKQQRRSGINCQIVWVYVLVSVYVYVCECVFACIFWGWLVMVATAILTIYLYLAVIL